MRKTILLIDDDPSVLRMLALALSRRYDVIGLSDSQVVAKALRSHPPDVILCDIDMPHFSGGELSERVAADPRMADIPFIFLTGLVSREELQELDGLVAGRPAFSKSAPMAELAQFIEEVCAQAEQERRSSAPAPLA